MSDLVVTRTLVIPAADLQWSAVRSSGPGGGNVNRVATKVELRFNLPGTTALTGPVKERLRHLASNRLDADGRIVIVDQTTRTQGQNLDKARERLAELVRSSLRPPKKRRPTKPTASSKRRRLDSKQKQSEKKRARRRGTDD